MAYLTFNDLQSRRGILKKAFESHDFSESKLYKTNVFLSHRHKDAEIVRSVIGWLLNFNVDLYIDLMDYSLPDKTDGTTALKIKEKIENADIFILLATENSLESKWIPWELGIGDTLKGLKNVAILPLLDNKDQWKEREYYQIYGSIQKSAQGNWCFFAPGERGIRLEEWFNNNF